MYGPVCQVAFIASILNLDKQFNKLFRKIFVYLEFA